MLGRDQSRAKVAKFAGISERTISYWRQIPAFAAEEQRTRESWGSHA